MNITSYLANKCLEFLLSAGLESPEGQGPIRKQSHNLSLAPAPPWVSNLDLFKRECDGCGECVSNCETGVLVLGTDNSPQVDFSNGACSFCGKCSDSCPHSLFACPGTEHPWDFKAFITTDCLSHNNVLCRTCAEHCDVGAITIEKTNGFLTVPKVIIEKCNGCGACFSPCPVRAIKITSSIEEEKS